jgi:hypothetical protein
MKRSKKGRAVYTQIGVWREKDGSIHLTLKGIKGGLMPMPQNAMGTPPCSPVWTSS